MNDPLRLAASWCLICVCMNSAVLAQDSAGETAIKKWKEAASQFMELRSEQQTIIVRGLEKAEKSAQQANDAALAAEIRSEIDKFTSDGSLPTFVNTTAYEKKLTGAQKSLAQTAQRTIAVLTGAMLQGEIKAVEAELAKLTEPPPNDDLTPVRVLPGRDPRVAWGTKVQRNTFQLLKSGVWRESVENASNSMHYWDEVARTPQFIEIYDAQRKFGMRLMAAEAQVDYEYSPNVAAKFRKWNDGAWFNPHKKQ